MKRFYIGLGFILCIEICNAQQEKAKPELLPMKKAENTLIKSQIQIPELRAFSIDTSGKSEKQEVTANPVLKIFAVEKK